MEPINGMLSTVPGVQVFAISPNSLNIRGGGNGLTFAVSGTNVDEMTEAAGALVAVMAQDDAFSNPQVSGDSVQAQFEITVDQEMANAFGLSEAEITKTISALTQGTVAVSVFVDDTETDVRVVPGGGQSTTRMTSRTSSSACLAVNMSLFPPRRH